MRKALHALSTNHTFWVTVSFLIVVVFFALSIESFANPGNLLSSARNASFIGLMALGATVVIISGGIDLSVGSVMGLAAVVAASVMHAGYSLLLGVLSGLFTGAVCGVVNGVTISLLRVSPFVVTLGMLSIARSLAVVISQNKTLYELGPDQGLLLGVGAMQLAPVGVVGATFILLIGALYFTPWGKHVHALGGNEEAAHRTGVSVPVVKVSVYILSSTLAALAGLLMLSWLGSVSSSLGTGEELRVVAATVIGGTQLSGGYGSFVGALVGAALLEVIRNGLNLSGINPDWQGTFVGVFIITAVAVDALKHQLGVSKRSLQRFVFFGALAFVGLGIVATQMRGVKNHDGKRDAKIFAVVPKFMNHPFFEQARQGCEAAAQEKDDMKCLFLGPNEPSEQAQIQILQDLVARGVNGIALAPANSSASGRALQAAREAGIPVVTWDSDLLPNDRVLRLSYVGTENYKLGFELGRLFKEFRPKGGTFAMISGGAAAENLNERMQGVRDALKGEGFIEVAGTPLYCNDDSALAVQQLEDLLGKYSTLNGVISVGAWPLSVKHAYSLVMAKQRARLESKDLVILSADTLPMQLELVNEGLAHGLVGQRPFEMGYQVMMTLRKIVVGEPVADPIFTGLDVCTPQSLTECMRPRR